MPTKKEEKITTLKEYKLYPESGYLYMSLTYEIEDEHVIKEIHIPKIATWIPTGGEPFINHLTTSNHGDVYDVKLDIGPMEYQIIKGGVYDTYLTEKILYEKPTEMTLEEIEKKLGYKIKIVSEKERTNA